MLPWASPQVPSDTFRDIELDDFQQDLISTSASASASAPTLSALTKAERIKILAREFGVSSPSRDNRRVLSDDAIGSVDSRGRLITVGPRKRTAARVGQGLVSLTAGIASIYPALFIKLPQNSTPPPAHKLGTYALYIISVLAFLTHIYFFLIRGCCGTRKEKDLGDPLTQAGLTMLPIQAINSDRKGNKARKAGRKKGLNAAGTVGDVQINLIMDPRVLNYPDSLPGENGSLDSRGLISDASSPQGARRTVRRSHWHGLAMERAWNMARSRLKRVIIYDALMFIIWCVEFGFVIIGPRCPIGGYLGWCDGFNIATASTAFLILLFALSLFFDVRDLMVSKISPRERT